MPEKYKLNKEFEVRTEAVKTFVLSYSVTKDLGVALASLSNAGASIHYMIEEDGKPTIKLDPSIQVSYMCGPSEFNGEPKVNNRSTNIMLMNDSKSLFAGAQIDSLLERLNAIKPQFPDMDPKIDIVGLGEVAIKEAELVKKDDGTLVYALTRKENGKTIIELELEKGEGKIFPRHIAPGKFFPWEKLFEEGFGLFLKTTHEQKTQILVSPTSTEAEITALQTKLQEYGYPIQMTGIYDNATKAWVTRFNERFVPSVARELELMVHALVSKVKSGEFYILNDFKKINTELDDLKLILGEVTSTGFPLKSGFEKLSFQELRSSISNAQSEAESLQREKLFSRNSSKDDSKLRSSLDEVELKLEQFTTGLEQLWNKGSELSLEHVLEYKSKHTHTATQSVSLRSTLFLPIVDEAPAPVLSEATTPEVQLGKS